ncbi:MAG TPA: molybdopterin oxidoreductase family protein [Streptosporangiaceae bacterium]
MGKTVTATHCPYCSLQCGMELVASPAGIQVRGRDFPVNNGGLCKKGWTAADLLRGDRLTTPLVRWQRDGPLRPASFPAAIDAAATRIRATQQKYGRNAVGVFGGGGLTNEKCYLLGKFARVALRTKNIDYNGRFCMSSAAAAAQRAFGVDRGLPFPLADIAETGLVVLVGSNVAETMPPAMQWLARQRAAGGELIVIDPRRTATAEGADLHLQPVPGTDLALAAGLLHLLVADGGVDDDFVAARTTGFGEVRRLAAAWWPERVERVSGVAAGRLREAARRLREAPTAMILTARGAEQHSHGTDTASGWINLALARGLPGRAYSGYGTLTGQGNGQGGREHGQKSDQLPGYRRLADPAHRAHMAAVWGIEPGDLPEPGPSAYELLGALGSDVQTLLVAGSNPVVSAPRAARVEAGLRALNSLIVCDVVLSETAALADVVFPVTQWAEESGTMTNLEGRVLLRRRATAPPPRVRTDLTVLSTLAGRLGVARGFPDDPREVFDELRAASAGGVADYSGITWERIEAEDGVFWPCPAPDHPGTPRMFADDFPTPDGRARFQPVEPAFPAEQPDDAYPLWLTTGRLPGQYQSGAQTRRISRLCGRVPRVEVHPSLAAALALAHGETARIVSRRGSAEFAVSVSDAIRADTVFVPFHWGGTARANSLTDPALDPTSGMPGFKACAVRLEKPEKPEKYEEGTG